MARILLLTAVVVALVVVCYGYFFHKPATSPPADSVPPQEVLVAADVKPPPSAPAATKPNDPNAILTELKGNGRNWMMLSAINNSTTPQTVSIKVGDLYESGRSRVMAIENIDVEIAPASTTPIKFRTVSVRVSNDLADNPYRISKLDLPRLKQLISYLKNTSILPSQPVIQTAALILAEDRPLRTFAKFAIAGDSPSLFAGSAEPPNPDAYKVETTHILHAVALLKDAGVNISTLDVPQHPQLKLEAMLRRPTHDAAKKFYGMDEQQEWAYWKEILTAGDPQIRHYALYAIGQYFPETAINMLPGWALNESLQPAYRIAAIHALGLTGSPKAANTLLALKNEFPSGSKLGAAAAKAHQYISQHLD